MEVEANDIDAAVVVVVVVGAGVVLPVPTSLPPHPEIVATTAERRRANMNFVCLD